MRSFGPRGHHAASPRERRESEVARMRSFFRFVLLPEKRARTDDFAINGDFDRNRPSPSDRDCASGNIAMLFDLCLELLFLGRPG